MNIEIGIEKNSYSITISIFRKNKKFCLYLSNYITVWIKNNNLNSGRNINKFFPFIDNLKLSHKEIYLQDDSEDDDTNNPIIRKLFVKSKDLKKFRLQEYNRNISPKALILLQFLNLKK